MIKLIRLLVTAYIAVALCGCGVIYKLDIQQGNLLNKTLVESLKPGMTKRQVTLVMGSPALVSPFEQNRWDYISSIRRGRSKMDTKDLTLRFENDALVSIDGDYFSEDAAQLIKDATKYKRQYPDEKRPDEGKKKRGGGDEGGDQS